VTKFLILLLLLCIPGLLRAEKITLAYVAVNPGQGMLWVARDSGLLAKHGFTADVVLIPGSPRTTQALIAGDLDYAVAGAAAGWSAVYIGRTEQRTETRCGLTVIRRETRRSVFATTSTRVGYLIFLNLRVLRALRGK